MVWRCVKSELLVEGGGIRHTLVWDDDYCIECNSPADYGKEPMTHRNRCTGNRRTETDGCSILNPQLCRLLRCPSCGASWTTNTGRALSNWESVIEHLLCKNDMANFIKAQNRARVVARAKAAGFSIGWIADSIDSIDWDHNTDSEPTPTPPEMTPQSPPPIKHSGEARRE